MNARLLVLALLVPFQLFRVESASGGLRDTTNARKSAPQLVKVGAAFVSMLGPAGEPQKPYKPLDKGTIEVLVRAGVETGQVVKMVEERGIDFDPTDSYLQTLRDAGASDDLLKALRAAKRAKSPESKAAGALELQLSARDKVWVAVDADGKPALELAMNRGDTVTVSAKDFFDVTADNGQALALAFQNEGLGPIGNSSTIKSAHLTRQNLMDMLAVQKANRTLGVAPSGEQAGQISPAPQPARVETGSGAYTHLPGEEIYEVGGDVTAPVAIHKPSPDYTTEAMRAKVSGSVLLGIIVDAHGKVTHPRVIKGLGMGLDENALETVRNWKFKPATREGVPVAVHYEVEFHFKLGQ
jgi:TonB family protein